MSASRLTEIKDEIESLVREALNNVEHDERSRCRSYWHNQILSALGTDDFTGTSMFSLQDTIDTEQEEEYDEEE